MQNNQNYMPNQGLTAYSSTNMNALNQNQSTLSGNSYIPSSVYSVPNQSTLSGQYANQNYMPNQASTAYSTNNNMNALNQNQLSSYGNAYIPSSVYSTPNQSTFSGQYSNQNHMPNQSLNAYSANNTYIPSSVYPTPNQSTFRGQYANQNYMPNNYSNTLNQNQQQQNQQVNTSYIHSLVSTPSMPSNNFNNQRQLNDMSYMNNNLYNNAYIPSSVYPTPNNSIGSYNYTSSSMQPPSGLTPYNQNSNQYAMTSPNNYNPIDVNNNYSYTPSTNMSSPNTNTQQATNLEATNTANSQSE